MNIELVQQPQTESLDQIRTLFREYEQFLGVSLCFQSFEQELASLPGKYCTQHNGALFLATDSDGKASGCVAIYEVDANPVDAKVCELKRLFVRPEFQGRGLGRELMDIATAKAIDLGYRKMLLDTLARLEKACQLYRSLGFEQTQPYNENPHDDVLYFQKQLVP